jgi:hypothetical protein
MSRIPKIDKYHTRLLVHIDGVDVTLDQVLQTLAQIPKLGNRAPRRVVPDLWNFGVEISRMSTSTTSQLRQFGLIEIGEHLLCGIKRRERWKNQGQRWPASALR